jgi:hypothetical protein
MYRATSAIYVQDIPQPMKKDPTHHYATIRGNSSDAICLHVIAWNTQSCSTVLQQIGRDAVRLMGNATNNQLKCQTNICHFSDQFIVSI